MLTRKNVWELGKDWADPILWYARGVAALKARPLTEPTSWRFYAAIHGINQSLWRQSGNLVANEPMPSGAIMRRFWNQCQHGSWYFLPWHRGYVWAFEAIVRAAIVELEGPADWSLPYWNYFKGNQNRLPPAFASPDWPDGEGNNPLFVPERYGPNGDGNVFVITELVNLNALEEPEFTGTSNGGSVGFGGVNTGFSHGGRIHGAVETQPHDWVHGLVGGSIEDEIRVERPGLMSHPKTAGLDPIFWLHHANIDRLWEVWRQNPPSHVDPTEPRWLAGPASTGERPFEMPMPDGSTWAFTPEDVASLAKLEYTYDDLRAVVPPAEFTARVNRLRAAFTARRTTVPREEETELLGASREAVPLQGAGVRASIQLDKSTRDRMVNRLARVGARAAPDRVFLNLENVRGLSDATAFRVYVGSPSDALSDRDPEHLAGNIALFGVSDASDGNQEHGGAGLTFVLEITDLIDTLHLGGKLDVDSLDVRFVPIKPIPESARISIGRISLFRQGG